MSSKLVAAPIDLQRVREALGSGEEKLCAAVLKTLPKDAPELKAWTRAVCLLFLGAEGEALSGRDPFTDQKPIDPDPDQAAALRFILMGMAAGPALPVSNPDPRLLRRPLFGWNPPARGKGWGALSRGEAKTDPDLERILQGAPGLDLVSWTV